MRLVDIDECNRELFYKQTGGKDSLITVEASFDMLEALYSDRAKERYNWHDLRKNPDDLPSDDNNSEVIYIKKGGSYYFSDTYTLRLYLEYAKKEYEDVIAWKYIEPFKEVEE